LFGGWMAHDISVRVALVIGASESEQQLVLCEGTNWQHAGEPEHAQEGL